MLKRDIKDSEASKEDVVVNSTLSKSMTPNQLTNILSKIDVHIEELKSELAILNAEIKWSENQKRSVDWIAEFGNRIDQMDNFNYEE